MRKKCVLVMMLMILLAATQVAAQTSGPIHSGWYRVDSSAYGNYYPAMWMLLVKNNSISGMSYWGGEGFHKMEGNLQGKTLTVTRSWNENGKVLQQVYTGTIKGNTIEGTFKAALEAGGQGTWKLYLK